MNAVRRVSSVVLKGACIVLAALVLAEIVLQAAALFARGRETAWRPAAAHKILCIGDSHTYGALVPTGDSYPGQLQRLLDEHAPGAYSVVNLGIPGMNTAQVRDRLRTVLGRERPDLVVVWCGVNDAWNRTESGGAPTGSSRVADAVRRLRLYRLLRTWQNDRRIDHVLAQIVPASQSAQQRYEVVDKTNPETPDRRRLAVVSGDGAEELAFEDTGLRVEPEMEDRAARDYRRMVEDSRAVGVPIAFVAYPVDEDAFRLANRAVRRVAAEYAVPVVESSRSVQRVPEAKREMLWAGHPNGPMYAEIARDVMRVVLGGWLGEMKFDADELPEASVASGTCGRATTGCAAGAGCYRWNPRGTPCNVGEPLLPSERPVRASARFFVHTFPAGPGPYDLLRLSEDRFSTGYYAQLTDQNRLQLLAMGSSSSHRTCGPLPTRVTPGTWYELGVRASKSEHASATLELRTAAGEVVDSVTCTDLPAGGGTFTEVTVGSTNPSGIVGDITFDEVAVYEDGERRIR